MSEWFDAVAALMHRGGPVMWPIVLCSILTVFVTLRKLLQWSFFRLAVAMNAGEWDRNLAVLAEGKRDTSAFTKHSPYSRILVSALKRKDLSAVEALASEAQTLSRKLAFGLGLLDTVVTLAPMLGILGTVTGIITSFELMGSSGVDDPTGIASGIAEALITTAAGLVVSIVALVPLNVGRVCHRALILKLQDAMTAAEKYLEKDA